MKLKKRQSKNIEKAKSAREQFEAVKDPDSLEKAKMTYLLGMKNAKEKDKDKTHRVGRKNEYKTEGKKNTRKNGTVPVPEDKPRYYAGPAHGSGDK